MKIITILFALALAVTVQAQSAVKISALPTAATLSGSEIIPLDQSGSTVVASVNQLVAASASPVIPSLGNLLSWWDAGTISGTNGLPITIWNDRWGTNALYVSGGHPTFSPAAIAGLPSIIFSDGASCLTATNFFVKNPGLATNFTLAIVYRNMAEPNALSGVANGEVFSSGTATTTGTYFCPWLVFPGPAQSVLNNGSYGFNFGVSGGQPNDVLVWRVSINATNKIWHNGRWVWAGENIAGGYPTVLGGNFNLGAYMANNFFSGQIAEVAIYATNLPDSSVQVLNNYLMTKYHLRGLNICLASDSVGLGADVTNGFNTLGAQLHAAFGCEVDISSRVGITSGVQTNYMLPVNFPSAKPEALNILCYMESTVNDQGNSFTTAQSENNITTICRTFKTNGWQRVFLMTPVDYTNNYPSLYGTTVAAWEVANWSSMCDGLARFDQIPQVGPVGACQSAVYFASDHTHPLDAGYLLMGPVLISCIQSNLAVEAGFMPLGTTVVGSQTPWNSGINANNNNLTNVNSIYATTINSSNSQYMHLPSSSGITGLYEDSQSAQIQNWIGDSTGLSNRWSWGACNALATGNYTLDLFFMPLQSAAYGAGAVLPAWCGSQPVAFCVATNGSAYAYSNFISYRGQFIGNAAGLTNFALLALTNSATGWLTPGLAKAAPSLGFVSVCVVCTNSTIVWLSNATSHYCVQMGNLSGIWTNFDNAILPVNSGDNVMVTNIGSATGWALVQSYYQQLR